MIGRNQSDLQSDSMLKISIKIFTGYLKKHLDFLSFGPLGLQHRILSINTVLFHNVLKTQIYAI